MHTHIYIYTYVHTHTHTHIYIIYKLHILTNPVFSPRPAWKVRLRRCEVCA